MYKIKKYSVYSAKTALAKPISDSTHTLTEISFVVVRIEVDNGVIGESYLLSFQYSPSAIAGALKDVGDMLIGENVHDTVSVFSKVDAANEYFGKEGINRWAQGAYNVAMWDAWGKILEQPIWKILGTSRTEVPLYGSGGWLSYTTDELIDEVLGYKKRGFKGVKIKVGKENWQEDLERLKLVREKVAMK